MALAESKRLQLLGDENMETAKERVFIARVEMMRGKNTVVDLRDKQGTLRQSVVLTRVKSLSHKKIAERAIAYASEHSEYFDYQPGGTMTYSWTMA